MREEEREALLRSKLATASVTPSTPSKVAGSFSTLRHGIASRGRLHPLAVGGWAAPPSLPLSAPERPPDRERLRADLATAGVAPGGAILP